MSNSNLSSGNSSEEADETPNVLSSTSDGSSAHQEQTLPNNKKRRKLPGNPGKFNSLIVLAVVLIYYTFSYFSSIVVSRL